MRVNEQKDAEVAHRLSVTQLLFDGYTTGTQEKFHFSEDTTKP